MFRLICSSRLTILGTHWSPLVIQTSNHEDPFVIGNWLIISRPVAWDQETASLICAPEVQYPPLTEYRASRRGRLERIQFHMRVHPPEGAATSDIYHTYSEVQCEIGAPPKPLDDIEDWEQSYPDLLRILGNEEVFQGEVILLNCNLKLQNDLIPRSRLAIHLVADIQCNNEWNPFHAKTSWYEKGKLVQVSHDELTAKQLPGSARFQVDIPLKSSWWIQLFSNIKGRQRLIAEEFNARRLESDQPNWFVS